MKKLLLPALIGFLAAQPSQSAVIISDSLNGSASSDLNGATPTTGSGTWLAQNWKRDGSIVSGTTSNAIIGFTANSGLIYELSATLNPTEANGNWMALGFFSGSPGTTTPFWGTADSRAWMLVTGDHTAIQTVSFPCGETG
jgi:hypothetical protein